MQHRLYLETRCLIAFSFVFLNFLLRCCFVLQDWIFWYCSFILICNIHFPAY